MRKIYLMPLISLLMLMMLTGCSDDQTNDVAASSGNVTEVHFTPFIGSVKMSWKNPPGDDYYYTLVSYQKSDGTVVNNKYSRFLADENGYTNTILGGFTDTKEYTFTLQSFNYDGSCSEPVSVKCQPQDASGASAYVVETADITASSYGAELTWTNETGIGVRLIMSYLNNMGVLMEEEIDATKSGSFSITDLGVGDTEFTLLAENMDDYITSPTRTFVIKSSIDDSDIIRIWFDPTRTEAVFFDYAPVGLTYEVTGTDSYALMIDPTATERLIISEPIGKSLPRKDMVLSFQYRCQDNFNLTLLYYPFEWATIADYYSNKGLMGKTLDWKTLSFDLSGDIERLKWGTNPTSQIRFIFTTENTQNKKSTILFEIRNIQIRPGK